MNRDHGKVTAWLLIGVVMVFIQILLGGITRLTGSGLSITKWDIVMGALPPFNENQWNATFNLYKETPQYKHINQGMDLSRFKFIFFWEFIHRLWARSMGFVFLIPFVYFLLRRSLSRQTLYRLAVVIGFATLAAVFGWIMVASGLVQRPWVNAYKLTIHLSLGIGLFLSLVFAWIKEKNLPSIEVEKSEKGAIRYLLFLTVVQVVLGGMMSGMKAALLYPSWPKMNGTWIPAIVTDLSHWNSDNFLFYDQSGFMPAVIQVLHRFTGYLILASMIYYVWKWLKKPVNNSPVNWYGLLGIIVVQIILGILTLISSIGAIPVLLGTLHQAVGILFLTLIFKFYIRTKTNTSYKILNINNLSK